MKKQPYKNYEYVLKETRTYVLVASGRNELEANQEVKGLFHRLAKRGELVPYSVSKPTVVTKERIRDTKRSVRVSTED